MKTDRKVSITISVSKTYRDQLRTMAARRNFHDPDQLTSASTIAREIVCEHIDELDRVEADFQATDNDSNRRADEDLIVPSQENDLKTNGETVQ